MSYYVETIESNFVLKSENYDKAYQAVCELNRNDDAKQGGCYGGEPAMKPVNSNSVSNNPNKWYSWMQWNYDETCNNIIEVLEMLGFDVCANENAIDGLYYDNKMGQEDIFFDAIAPYVESGSYIVWCGEDRTMWVWAFEDGKMIEKEARITW